MRWTGDPSIELTDVAWSVRKTSRGPGRTTLRWSEIEIHKTAADGYVVFLCGRSAHPGEEDRYSLLYCATPDELIIRLARPRGGTAGARLPWYAHDALCAAAEAEKRAENGSPTLPSPVEASLAAWEEMNGRWGGR